MTSKSAAKPGPTSNGAIIDATIFLSPHKLIDKGLGGIEWTSLSLRIKRGSYLDTLAWNHGKRKNTLNHKHSKNDLKFAGEMHRTHWNTMNKLEAIPNGHTSPSKRQVTPRQGSNLVPGQIPTSRTDQNCFLQMLSNSLTHIMAEVPSHKAVGTCWNISSVHFFPALSSHNTPFKLQRTCIRESKDEAANGPATWILDRKWS